MLERRKFLLRHRECNKHTIKLIIARPTSRRKVAEREICGVAGAEAFISSVLYGVQSSRMHRSTPGFVLTVTMHTDRNNSGKS